MTDSDNQAEENSKSILKVMNFTPDFIEKAK